MRFCLVHLDNQVHPGEEASVMVPGHKVVSMVPLAALSQFLPLLHEAVEELEVATCSCCDEQLPGRPPEPPLRREF